MAEFICRLGTPAGEIVTRTVEGLTREELRARLVQEGYSIFSVEASGSGSSLLGNTQRGIKVKLDDFLLFNQQMAALIHAGLPVLQSIQMLRHRSPSARLREVLGDVETRIKSGAALSEAFAAQGETFPKIYIASILAGERSGSLDEILRRYVVYTKAMAAVRRKLRSALTYPCILLGASVILIAVLTTYVIPQFSSIYENVGTKLPLITEFVIGISSAVRNNLLWLLPTILIAGFALWSWRKTENGRRTMDRLLLRIPIVGDLVRQMTTAQFTRSLATLLAGGITLVEGFQIALSSITNRELLRLTEPALPKVREGKPFTESLAASGWVPELAVDMIGVGERSGSLREMLEEVAGFYDAETEVKLGQLTTFIEPAILITMGGVVVTILMAIYLPLLTMMGSAGK
ncbi:MAG TPA: type II secretion system F family protein [Blastocatellia bacterium]|nr:type II secretion system F family protein [Blastocatellia bacterium]